MMESRSGKWDIFIKFASSFEVLSFSIRFFAKFGRHFVSYLFGKPLAHRRRAAGIVGDDFLPNQISCHSKSSSEETLCFPFIYIITVGNDVQWNPYITMYQGTDKITSLLIGVSLETDPRYNGVGEKKNNYRYIEVTTKLIALLKDKEFKTL